MSPTEPSADPHAPHDPERDGIDFDKGRAAAPLDLTPAVPRKAPMNTFGEPDAADEPMAEAGQGTVPDNDAAGNETPISSIFYDKRPQADAAATLAEEPASPALAIEWFDEEREPPRGHLFAEPPPEPPAKPFEVQREMPGESVGPTPNRNAARRGYAMDASVRTYAPPLLMRVLWSLMPLLLLVVGYGSVILTWRDIGYAWDESYYYEPAQKAADWLTAALRGEQPFDRASIDKYWEERSEHPSVQKLLSGIAMRAFPEPKDHLFAMRLPIAILFGLSLTLIYQLGRRMTGNVPALAAALMYGAMPQIFGYAHFATMETPLVFMMLLVTWCYLRGLESPFWAVITGISFGLLLATKINGFFLPVALVTWGHLYARRQHVNNLMALLILGPICFVLAWPWLWHDTVMRVLQYLAFHAAHQKTAVYFMGQMWGLEGPNAPWYYPPVMIAVTTPLLTLALMAFGSMIVLLKPHRRPLGALFLLIALANLGVACAPGTPKYDGIRLFLPAYPFLALLGAAGFGSLITMIEKGLRAARRDALYSRRFTRLAALGLCLLIVLEGGWAIARTYPYPLAYFNQLIGGVRGAEKRGFEVTYWGEALNGEAIEAINKLRAADGSKAVRLKALALHDVNLQHLQRWGVINPEIQLDGPPPYDYAVLQMRRGFFRRPERALADSGLFAKVHVQALQGVPLLAIYRTGIEFERYWPTLPVNDPAAPPTGH